MANPQHLKIPDSVYRSCINSIVASSPNITDKEAKELLQRLSAIKKATAIQGGRVPMTSTLQDVLKEQLDNIRTGRKQKSLQLALQKQARANKVALLINKNPLAKDQLKAFMGNLLGTFNEKDGGKFSTDVRMQSLATQAVADLEKGLKEQGLYSHFAKGIDELHVAQELSELNSKNGKPGTHGNKDAQKVAKVIYGVVSKYLSMGERYGIFVDKLEGYSSAQNHDPDLIRKSGEQKWVTDIMPRLAKLKTFGALDPSKWQEFMHNKYLNIISGQHLTYDGGVDKSFRPVGSNLAAKAAAERTIHFNSTLDAYQYGKDYGLRTFRDQIATSLDGMAKRISLAQEWGVNAELNMRNVLTQIRENAREQEDIGTQSTIEGKATLRNVLGTPEETIREVLGYTRTPAQKNFWYALNKFLTTLRSTASLGTATISAQTDLINLAGHLATISGNNPVMEMVRVASKYYNPASGKNLAEISSQCGMLAQALRAQLLQDRFNGMDATGITGKLSALYFKLNALHFHDQRITNVSAAFMASHFGTMADKDFASLPIETRTWLQRFDISEADWNQVRKFTTKGGDGQTYLTPTAAESIQGTQEEKDLLHLKISSMFTDAANLTVPRAGARERVIMYRGTAPDTFAGSALRMLFLFKTFPVTMVTKILNRNIYGQAKGTLNTTMSAATMYAMTIIAGIGIYALKQFISGKTSPNPYAKGGLKTLLMRGATSGGGLGYLGDVLLPQDDKEKFADTAKDLALGPIGGDLMNLGGEGIDLAKGNDTPKNAEKKVMNTAFNYVPFSNHFATKFLFNYYVRYAIMNSIDPDYTKKLEKNMKKNDDTHFIIPPAVNARH